MPLPSVTEAYIKLVKKSGYFSPDWYCERYADVAISGMDPLTHFLSFGTLLSRDPGPDFSSLYYREYHGPEVVGTMNPLVHMLRNPEVTGRGDHVLMAAGRLSRMGQHAQALAYALRDLPSDLRHSKAALEANLAVSCGDLCGWERAVNEYLRWHNQATLKLDMQKKTMLDRLSCGTLAMQTDGPLISVLMAVWNCEDTVQAAISSILAQTWQRFELLVVDDASTDRTWEFIRKLAASDSRIRCWRNTINVGPFVSKNIALKMSKGAFITGHDGDDWAHPERLARQAHYMLEENQSIPVSGLQALRMEPNGTFSYLSRARLPFSADGLIRHAPITFMFRRNFLTRTLGHWDSVRFGGDTEMSRRAQAAMGKPVPELPYVGLICLDAPTSLTNDAKYGTRVNRGRTSQVRRDYLDALTEWHQTQPSQDALFVAFPAERRRFPAPNEMQVPVHDVQALLNDFHRARTNQ